MWCQPATGDAEIDYPGTEMRQVFRALAGAQGVLAPASNVVTHRAAGANFSVDVAAFQAIIIGDDIADQGNYLITNTAGAVNVTTPAAPGSGTRTHRLVAQVQDHRANGAYAAGTYNWVLSLLTDTGTGEPAEPASALTLAHVSIAAGQANVADSNITNAYAVLRTLNPLGPWVSNQVNPAAWNASSVWTDFTSGNWPPLTFTVPPSGKVFVTISASPYGTGTSGDILIGWRMSGTDTYAAAAWHAVGSQVGTGGTQASKRRLLTGLTPGATDTITPNWWKTASTANDQGDGQLIVEAAAS